MSPRAQNEKQFGHWDELPGGGRRYRLDVPGKLVETHEKFPVDKGHQKVQDTTMTITKQTVADKIAAYLHHEITLAQLVDWSERAIMDGAACRA